MTNQTTSTNEPKQNSFKMPLIIISIFALTFGAAYFFGILDFFSVRSLVIHYGDLRNFTADNIVLAVAAYVAIYSVAIALSLPIALLMSIGGGLLFGAIFGGVGVIIAVAIGTSILYFAARTGFRDLFTAKAGETIKKLEDGFRKDAFSYLLFLRLAPIFPFFVVNIVPPILGIPYRTYAVATIIGVIPGSFALTSIGGGISGPILDEANKFQTCSNAMSSELCPIDLNLADFISAQTTIVLGAIAVLALIPPIAKHFMSKKAQ